MIIFFIISAILNDFFKSVLDFFENLGSFGLFIYTFLETLLLIPPIELLQIPLTLINPHLWFYYVLIIGLSTLISASLGYYIAYKLGYKIFSKIGIKEKSLIKAEKLFRKYDIYAIAFCSITPFPYTIGVYLAGVCRMNFLKFIVITALTRILRFILVGYLIYKFASNIEGANEILGKISNYSLILFFIFIIFFIFNYLYNLIHKKIIIKIYNKKIGDSYFKKIFFYQKLESTNIKALSLINDDNKIANNSILITYRQKKGKGTGNKVWISSNNKDITISYILKNFKIDINKIHFVTFAMALAVQELLKENSSRKSNIKWPNDVLLNNKKICGILTTYNHDENNNTYLICGIGLNVNNINKKLNNINATSLKIEEGKSFNLENLITKLTINFEKQINSLNTLDTVDFLKIYKNNLSSLNKQKNFKFEDQNLIGTALDINNDGHLIIKDNNNQLYLSTGEVVKKIKK